MRLLCPLLLAVGILLPKGSFSQANPLPGWMWFTINGGDWLFEIFADGSATVIWGAGDTHQLPAGAFSREKWAADFRKAISLAPPTPDRSVNPLEFYDALGKSGCQVAFDGTQAHAAEFTPEVKSYCDKLFAGDLPERIRFLTNRHPVIPDQAIERMSKWTNISARSIHSVTNPVPTKGAGKSPSADTGKPAGDAEKLDSKTNRKP